MKAQSPIRVAVVDDHVVVRKGLATFLVGHDDLEFVGDAADGIEALQLCDQVHPNVLLMDLFMPHMDGVTAVRTILKRYPQIAIIILTSFKDEKLIQNALKAGAMGYILKDVSPEELILAIRDAYAGRPTLGPEATRALIEASIKRSTPSLGHDLTDREHKVLELMSKGMDNSQIADILIISLSTVKFHVSNILSKLQVSSRTEAVALALRHEIADKPD
ncbi:MAG: response regulator transcription factor [Caldilineaceae bacterium]|nr:response regulator transcription factor [Caldilineaceae bacterium]